jgi:hypothetical protein
LDQWVLLPLIVKSRGTWPTFLKTNVTLPGFLADLVGKLATIDPEIVARIEETMKTRAAQFA